MKKWLFCLALFCSSFGIVELSFRILFAIKVTPSVFWFGTPFIHTRDLKTFDPRGVERREIAADLAKKDADGSFMVANNRVNNYAKYFPHQVRYGYTVNGEKFKITINSRGLRGREFTEPKRPEVIRIINLGASPTFGDENRDDETYSYYMEEMLNQRLATRPCGEIQAFEVMNFGIPRLNSDQIYALFMAEALELQPDVVTFYEGINDTTLYKGTGGIAAQLVKKYPVVFYLRSLFLVLRDKLMILALFDNANDLNRQVVPDAKAQSTSVTAERMFAETDVQAHIAGRSEYFLKNLSKIYQACQERQITFLVANQQVASLLIPRNKLKGVTLQEEVTLVREKLMKTGHLSLVEMHFLTHDAIMHDLRQWANERQIPFVDIISSLDQDRDQLIGWCHFTAEGNKLVAEQFTAVIFSSLCPH